MLTVPISLRAERALRLVHDGAQEPDVEDTKTKTGTMQAMVRIMLMVMMMTTMVMVMTPMVMVMMITLVGARGGVAGQQGGHWL